MQYNGVTTWYCTTTLQWKSLFSAFLWKVNWTVPKWKLFGTVILIIIITAVCANPRHKMNVCLMHSLSLSQDVAGLSMCIFLSRGVFYSILMYFVLWKFCCFCSVLLIHKPRTIKYNKNNASPLSHTSSPIFLTLYPVPTQSSLGVDVIDSTPLAILRCMALWCLHSVQGFTLATNNMKNACQTILHILLAVNQV